MVLLGGLEIVAAGYLIHQHQKNKRERALLREEAAALEDVQHHLQERPHRHTHSKSHSLDRQESREERRERHRRRRSRERREREKWEFEHGGGGRDHSAPPKMRAPQVRPPVVVVPMQTQTPQPNGFPPTGWPAHWKQTQTPPTPTPPPQAQPNGYPQDVKYGFIPEIPHDEYPPYPPPPFSPGPSGRDSRGRSNTLEVNDGRRGRPKTRRSVSPRLGVYDEYSRSPTPRVRFSTEEDGVLGEGRGLKSPPPKYRA